MGKFDDAIIKEPKVSKFESAIIQPRNTSPHDPRNGLSKSQIAEAEGNKSWAKGLDDTYNKATKYIPDALIPNALKTMKPSSMVAGAKGFTHNMDEYGASINKGLGKLSKAILPKEHQTTFFEDNAKFFNDKRKQNEIETEDNKIAKLAGQMIADPVNLTPAGIINKGTKLARVGKSMVAGAGVGYATSKAKNYGNDSLTDAQKTDEDIMSVGIVSALNGVIAGLTKGKITNAIKDVEHLTTSAREEADSAINAVINNPEEFGFSKAQATKLSEDYKTIVDRPQPELVREKSNATVPIEDIFAHPRAKEAIDLARDRYASQTYNDRVGGGSASWMNPDGTYARAGAQGETNYHQGFNLSKADVKKIDEGNITPEIEAKLRDDVDRLENDPNWNGESATDKALDETTFLNEKDELLDPKTGEVLFANAGHNLAGGFGAGTVNAGNGIFDDGDTTEKMADRFIQGMVAGTLGVSGLKALRKTNPQAFEKVRSWVMDNDVKVGDKMPTEGVQLGVFAGKKAKGFEGKTTLVGKYDGQKRFEIDDSVAEVNPNAVVELSQKGHTTLSKLMKHDELFSNYPQLENVVVKFDKNMEAHATFDGENVITLSNKFKNKDEMSSSILHEVQHWVQNKEGFAGGGNFYDMLRQVDGKIYDLEKRGELSELDAMNYRNDLDYLNDNRSAEAYNNYKKIAGEIEAREVQARHGLNADERGLIEPYNNSETLGAGQHSDEAYNSAFMAELDGKLKDFDTTGIDPKDATLDFSRNKSDAMGNPQTNDGDGLLTKHTFDDLERKAAEKSNKGWKDISNGNGFLKDLNNWRNSLFSDTFSGEYHKGRELVHTKTNESDEAIGRLAKVLDTLDDATDVLLHKYITKQGGENLPPEIKKLGDMVRKTIDDAGAELVRQGLLDEKAYKEWVGAYLHRLYEPKVGKDLLKGRAEGFKLDNVGERGLSEEFNPSDVKGLTGWLHREGFINDSELQSIQNAKQMEAFLKSEQRAGLLRDGKLSITKTVGGKIKLRRDWTKAERESMGEIESAKITIPQTLAKLNRLKQHAEFLSRVEKVDGAVLDKVTIKNSTRQEMMDAGYTQMKPDPRYGALSGKWVRNDVADDVGKLHTDINNLNNNLMRKWLGYHGLWKKSKTVWNPTAHVNNTVGNWALMHMGGLNTTQLPKILLKGKDGMKALSRLEDLEVRRIAGTLTRAEEAEVKGLEKTAKFAIEAKTNGIFGKSQLNDILAGMQETTVSSGVLKKIDKKASEWYQLEDNFNRLSFYQTLRETGRDAKTAKQMVDFMLPDYSKPLPKGWRRARDSGIAPFISWSYYTMPSIVRMMSTKTGAKGVAKVMGILSAMEYVLSDGEVGIMDNLPFYDGSKPEDFKGRRFVIGKDGDKLNTIKTDRLLPYAELKNPINYMQSQVSGVVPNAFVNLFLGKKLYNGRDITYKNKSTSDKTIDWVKNITGQYIPVPMPVMNMIDLADSKIRSKKKRKRNDTIIPRSSVQEVLKNVGINTISYSKRGAEKDNRR